MDDSETIQDIVLACITYSGRTEEDLLADYLAMALAARFPNAKVIGADFLEWEPPAGEKFDRIIMNPPFDGGVDIKHIEHAMGMLADGGRLVAICAAGPRQACNFKNSRWQWIPLPEGSFADQGTNVNTAMVILDK